MIVTEEVFSYGKTVMIDRVPIFDFTHDRIFCLGKDLKDIAVFKLKNYEKI